MAAGGLTDTYRVEIRTLKEYVAGLFGNARMKTAKHTGNGHRLVGVTYHQILRRQRTLHLIKRNELVALVSLADNHMVTLNLVGVERVERLPCLVQHEIGHIHHIVDRAQPDGCQRVLEPIRRLVYADALYAHTRIAGAVGGVLDSYLDREIVVLYLESVYARLGERQVGAVREIVGI